MAKSIIYPDSYYEWQRECYICHTTQSIEQHHLFYGGGLRALSDKHGMVVDLCQQHHRGKGGVHFDKELDLYLKRLFQAKFEETHGRDEFMAIFKRSYI